MRWGVAKSRGRWATILASANSNFVAWSLFFLLFVPVIALALLLMGLAVAVNWFLYNCSHTWRDKLERLADWYAG